MTLIEHRKGAHRCLEKPSVIYDMKHLISFLVILLCLSMLITCLASCGQTSDGPDKDAETKDQDSESQTEEESKTDDRKCRKRFIHKQYLRLQYQRSCKCAALLFTSTQGRWKPMNQMRNTKPSHHL